MRRIRDNDFSTFLPFRATGQRITLLILIFLSTALFVVGKTNTGLSEKARAGLADITVPVLDVLSQPILALDWAAKRVVDMVFVYRENDSALVFLRTFHQFAEPGYNITDRNEKPGI